MVNEFHKPVLLQEAIESLNIKQGKKYIDATIGGGGHGFEIVNKGGVVLGIDLDQDAIDYVKRRWKMESRKWNISEDNLVLVRGNFKNLGEIALSNGFDKVAGIIFDLGVSSWQLGSIGRGFSFQRDEPLDMRMETGLSITAADLVNGLTGKELYELFNKLGQEKYSWAISNSIARARKIKPIRTTRELADIIVKTYMTLKIKRGKIHPATKIFQALRVAVNGELENLRETLPKTVELLASGGRLVVISFHSLEDKIVKDFGENSGFNILTKKPIVPAMAEIKENPRSRSAKMRIFERI